MRYLSPPRHFETSSVEELLVEQWLNSGTEDEACSLHDMIEEIFGYEMALFDTHVFAYIYK